MNTKPIIIIAAEPNSIFSDIFFKVFKKNKFLKPIVLIASYKLFKKQMSFLKYNISFNKIDKNFRLEDLINNKVNIINIDLKFQRPFEKISSNSNYYNQKCFELALKLVKQHKLSGLINGPISKKHFLKNRFLGMTEYFAKKTNTKNYAMIIYSRNLAVSPITTHVPLKNVSKLISQKKIINQVSLIKKFYKKNFNKNAKIAITGLNPHCESNFVNSEEEKIIKPAIKSLKKKYSHISGPYSADSLFISKNIKNFDVVVGMYHDQVLTPLKSIHDFDAINITLGLPFLRISPDHGPNFKMVGKNNSNPNSLLAAIKFLDNT